MVSLETSESSEEFTINFCGFWKKNVWPHNIRLWRWIHGWVLQSLRGRSAAADAELVTQPRVPALITVFKLNSTWTLKIKSKVSCWHFSQQFSNLRSLSCHRGTILFRFLSKKTHSVSLNLNLSSPSAPLCTTAIYCQCSAKRGRLSMFQYNVIIIIFYTYDAVLLSLLQHSCVNKSALKCWLELNRSDISLLQIQCIGICGYVGWCVKGNVRMPKYVWGTLETVSPLKKVYF